MLVVGTVPGLKYDTTLLTAKAGARVRLVFKNNDDMLHNFVLTNPGRGDAIGQAALQLGLDGLANQLRARQPRRALPHGAPAARHDRGDLLRRAGEARRL